MMVLFQRSIKEYITKLSNQFLEGSKKIWISVIPAETLDFQAKLQ